VLFRQTNVIWVAFCVAVHVRHEQLARDPTQRLASPSKQLSSFVGYVARHMVAILRRYYGFVLVLLAFVAFVVLNGGIVVGTRQHSGAGAVGARGRVTDSCARVQVHATHTKHRSTLRSSGTLWHSAWRSQVLRRSSVQCTLCAAEAK